jgi:DNA-binding protein H-NS
MNVELNDLTIAELEGVIADAKALIRQHQDVRIHKSYIDILQIASAHGMSIEELVTIGRRINGKEKELPVKKTAPRYRNPKNPVETWNGRGRRPRWVEARLANGDSLDDFLIST